MTLEKTLDNLISITKGCRSDMHEPDEQGIVAMVTGTHLDNAFGNDPYKNQLEFTVGIERDGELTWFNLAELIALARKADLSLP